MSAPRALYIDAGFAFVVIDDEHELYTGGDYSFGELQVRVYDLEHQHEPLLGEPEVSGTFVTSYFISSLLDASAAVPGCDDLTEVRAFLAEL